MSTIIDKLQYSVWYCYLHNTHNHGCQMMGNDLELLVRRYIHFSSTLHQPNMILYMNIFHLNKTKLYGALISVTCWQPSCFNRGIFTCTTFCSRQEILWASSRSRNQIGLAVQDVGVLQTSYFIMSSTFIFEMIGLWNH